MNRIESCLITENLGMRRTFLYKLFLVWTILPTSENIANADIQSCEDAAKSKQEEFVLTECRSLAEAGDPRAQFLIAESTRHQSKLAQEWARKAAQQGYIPAQLLLATLLELSFDPKNKPEAIEWIKRAANAGDHSAEYRLGTYYSYPDDPSRPLKHSEQLSLQWIQKSAEGGFYLAQKYLGLHFEDGFGLPVDKAKSVYWYRKALQTEFDPALAIKLDGNAFSKPMKFAEYAPCSGSGCAEEIIGIGTIESHSYSELAKLNPRERQTVVLHSPGGDLMGGLRLGQEIRRRKLNTSVGGQYEAADTFGVIVEHSICASACAFAFLGGVERSVSDPQALLYHQFFSQLRVSAESTIQETVALLNNYVATMGVAREMLDGVLTTRPERLGYFSAKELWRYHITNTNPPEEVSEQVQGERNHWKLQFAGEQPLVVLQRLTDYSTGLISLIFTKDETLPSRYKLFLILEWTDQVDPSRLDSAFTTVKKRDANAAFCTTLNSSDACENPSLTLSVPGSAWGREANARWLLEYNISASQYSQLMSERPDNLTLDCNFSNAEHDFSFCDAPFVLSGDFYKLANLIK